VDDRQVIYSAFFIRVQCFCANEEALHTNKESVIFVIHRRKSPGR